MGILAAIKSHIAQRLVMRTPLAQALRVHTQNYLYGQTAISGFSDETKRRLASDLLEHVAAVFAAPNRRMKARELLCENVLLFVSMQVWCLKEFERDQAFYRDNPYITGGIYHHVQRAAEHNKEIANLIYEEGPMTDEALIAFCNARCVVALFHVNGLNMVRMELGDKAHRPEDDWFKPFIEAMLVYEEDNVRSKLGMPSLMPDALGSLAYSTYLNLVMSGEVDPLQKWLAASPKLYLSGKERRTTID